jgi:BNR/Asp-box repeat
VTDHRDPIEAWLSADVEPLPPRPGTFERVNRRARRRKAGRAISTAAGAAVVVAAAAILPQVAGGLLSGSPTQPSKVGPRASATSQQAGATIQAPRASGAALGGHGPALLGAGTGPAPAAGFRPTSVTFVTGSLGAVLGQAGSCGTGPCTVMAGTSDHGGSWSKVGAPPAPPPGAPSGVSQIRFLGPLNGWAYGPALYATHDGGRTWRRFTVRGRVIDLSAAGSRAFAVIGTRCAASGSDFAASCSRFVTYSAAARSDRWHAVAGATGVGPAAPGGLQLTGKHGYLVASGRLYAGPVTQGPWHRVAAAAPAAPPCLVPASGRGPWLLAPSASALYLVCGRSPAAASQKLALYVSRDGGRTWQARGAAPATATSLTVSPRGTLVLAAAAKIYFSRNARTWQIATLTGPAPKGGFGFVGMTTGADGVAVPASPVQHAIFITSDGGRTWRPSVIR